MILDALKNQEYENHLFLRKSKNAKLKRRKNQMKRKIISLTFFSFLFLYFSLPLLADEGMWMPHQIKALNLEALGLKMNPDELYREDGEGLMSAVVYLGGGTGEFVSSEGLILTNHHVAFGALQRASSAERDYIKDGFLAKTKEEEIPAPGYMADVLLGYEDVTEKIESSLSPSMSFRERYEAIDRAKKELIAEAEKEGKDIRAQVATMYSGNKYYLYRFKRIKDVRLVYAPPYDLGNFGGDIDNWMWPRHTCDFTFLRAYVSKENVGVDYNKENIPYRPKSFLKLSLEGFKEKDFTFVMGYPGKTFRNYTLAELLFDINEMKKRMKVFKDIIDFYEEAGKGKREIQIKYARIITGLNNSLKNYQGKIEGMEKISLIEKKKALEDDFLNWVNKSPQRREKYGKILTLIENFMARFEKHSTKSTSLSRLVNPYTGPALLSQAYLIYRTASEREKPDLEREAGYQERDLPEIRQRIELAERGYDLEIDRAYFKHLLKKLQKTPEEETPLALKGVLKRGDENALFSYVDSLYEKTSLANAQKRLELLSKKPEELVSLEDPFLSLASELEIEMKAMREEEKALEQERLELKKIYEAALLEKTEGRLAPDANSTIRFTYGFIEGYSPRDAVRYLPQTTLKGVIEKHRGEYPFNVPQKIKELYEKRDFGPYEDKNLSDIPVCFLNTTNVTGGNSGSPTLNARGEQIGIIFDMTYESVTGDYYIIPELQRSISVDIRYVLFVTEKFSGASHILRELGL